MSPARPLGVKIFADGASISEMTQLYARPYISGFTTNPTLMRRAGVRDYTAFARDAVAAIPDRPISFEVFSDAFEEMELQAHEIASWGENVYVKIPVTNTAGEPAADLIHRLSHSGVKVNVTAVLTLQQVDDATSALAGGAPSCISIFAGRIADTGRNPVPLIREARAVAGRATATELIWASPREVLNVFQAEEAGCHIITMTTDLLNKLHLLDRDLAALSLDTVKMFRDDAIKAGYTLKGLTQAI